ncbi:MAG: helix-turn-helix domain-containing protein [Deltaproteobacteria bacterium]|nr:helix-turn-helix domain-containing protein [Deltaproteobacteria bacterium]
MPTLLTYSEACAILKMKLPTLYSKVSRREIPHVRLSGRDVRFDADELARWIDDRRVRVGAVAPETPEH